MKKIFFLVVLSVFAIGCASSKSKKENKDETSKQGSHKGYEGIGMYR